jgi:hypothetical protein
MKFLLSIILLLSATCGFGISVAVEQILDAPAGPYGKVFNLDDRLEYLVNGSLVYMGSYPPNIYVVENGKFKALIGQYRNPIYNSGDARIIVTELLPSKVAGEFLYSIRMRGVQQENYAIRPGPVGTALVELVSKEYLDGNQDRKMPYDYSLKEGYTIDPQESSIITGGLDPVIRNSASEVVFQVSKIFIVGFIEHTPHITVSPDKSHIAMIVDYHPSKGEPSISRLVTFKVEYDSSKTNMEGDNSAK